MNQTIKQATVKRYHDDDHNHQQLRQHLDPFINAYSIARRLQSLKGRTAAYEFIYKQWADELIRFIANPLQKLTGLNS